MRKWFFSFLLCLSLALCVAALADTAADITADAVISATYNAEAIPHLTDGNQRSYWLGKRSYVQFDLPEGERCYGIYLCQREEPDRFIVETMNDQNEWLPVFQSDAIYLHEYVPLPDGAQSLRVRASGAMIMKITEARLYGEGDVPREAQRWETLEGKADLMLVSAHPDDEYLWFGGTLPTYAGERGKKVLVAYCSYGDICRKNELLDGLWTSGVKYYPVFAGFKDERADSRQEIYAAWGGSKTVNTWLVTQFRKYRPDVVITHDLNGEYGHGAHKVAAKAVAQSVAYAATDYDEKSLAAYSAWQVKKLYLHLYPEHEIIIPWDTPLSAFGGKTGMEVAAESLIKHKSQNGGGKHKMLESGAYDCRRFGLYASSVGEDVQKNDFFENIP